MAGYPNAWPGWEKAVLQAAKLPDTTANETFLASWHQYEGSNARNNPLNVTAYAPVPVTVGLGSVNSVGVQTYGTPQQGAQATAVFLNFPNFEGIHAALKSGDPYHYAAKSDANTTTITNELGKWGSKSFALVWQYEQGGAVAHTDMQTQQTTGNPDTGGQTQTTNTGPTDPLSAFLDFLGKLTTGSFWLRPLEVVGGAILALAGLWLLAKQIGLSAGINVPGPAAAVAAAAG